jgi:uncharacterized protein YggT (Ycf19 family)
MASPELLLVSILRAFVEVALYALIGQGVLALLAGNRRDTNPIYQLFRIVTRPMIGLARLITPAFILDRHVPLVAFFLLFWVWIGLAYLKRLV